MSYYPSELLPCIPLDLGLEPAGAAIGGVVAAAPAIIAADAGGVAVPAPTSTVAVLPPPPGGATGTTEIASDSTGGYGSLADAQVESLAAASGGDGRAAVTSADSKRRRDMALGLGLGVGLPGLMVLVAGEQMGWSEQGCRSWPSSRHRAKGGWGVSLT